MVRPEGALSFCGYVPKDNSTNTSSIFSNECFIDAVRTIPHVVFTFFIIPPLIALNRGSHYHARTWVHFPWHNARWFLTFILVTVDVLAIAEGFLSDQQYGGSHMHLFLPGIMSLLGTAMAVTYYHNIEMWNSPNFLQLPLVLYWLMNLATEIMKALCLGLKQLPLTYMRVHINWAIILLYTCLLLLELDARRQMKLFFCYKKPNILVPPDDLVQIDYIHDKVSLFSRITFFWMQRIICRGFHGYIDWRDLGELPQEDQISYQMQHVENEINLNQLFSDGLSLGIIYGKILRSWYGTITIGILTGVISDLILCVIPVMLGFMITYLKKVPNETTKAEIVILPANAQYISAIEFFSNGYILLTLITVLLVICTLLKETSRHLMSRVSFRLDNIIKALILKKFLQIRLKKLPNFTDAQQTASELINADWSPLIVGLFSLFKYLVKVTLCYAIIYYHCGHVSHVIVLIYFSGIVLLFFHHYNKAERNALTGNLLYVKQVRLQGNDSIRVMRSHLLRSQKDETSCLKRPVLFCSLYGCIIDVTVLVFSIILFPSMVRLEYAVPSTSSVIVVLLLLHCIRGTMPDVSALVDLLSVRIQLCHAGKVFHTEPVLGRILKESDSPEPSEASDPVIFSLEFRGRTPSPEHDVVQQSSNSVNNEENPFLEEVCGSKSKTCPDTSAGSVEMTEVTPMLGTITEECHSDAEAYKRVTFLTKPEKQLDIHSTPSHSTEDSLVEKGLDQHLSSGTFSHISDIDESSQMTSSRGIGVAVEIQAASCQDKVLLKDISLKVDDGKLTIITGPKLAGKSVLLESLLLGNIETMSGEVLWKPNSTVSYAGYPAWIIEASVMENILFGQRFDRHRYHKVLKACALMSDINLFPERDLTILGKYQLTDGQRNRITLARALYSHSDVVILNEPLSCMNVNKGSEIFEEGIMKYLLKRKRTVILATKQIQFFPFAHMIYRLENGEITHRGSLKDIKVTDGNLFNRWQNIAKMVRRESYANLSLCLNKPLTGQNRDRMDSGSKSVGSQDGAISESGSSKILYSTQSSREIHDDLLDMTEKGPVHLYGSFAYHTPKDYLGFAKFTYLFRTLWQLVIKVLVFTLSLLLIPILVLLTAVAYIFTLLWALHLDPANDVAHNATKHLDVTHEKFSYLNVWLCLATVTCILVLCDKLAISFSGLLTAYKVHRDLAKSLFQSALSSLVTPNTRHSLSQVHETNGIKQLQSLCESVATWIHTVVLIITTTVVLAAASPYVLIPALLSFIPEVLILMAYYRTARQFFHLHRFAQSNLQSSVYDFLKGLSIMRAYGREEHMLNILYDRCDARTNILLWKLALNSWLSIRMHLITVFLIMFCGLGLLCEGEDSVTLFGLAGFLFVFLLYYIRDIQLSSVQVIVDGCLSLGSMLKMSEIITVSSSIKDDSGHIPADWPRNGCLSYIDVALQYDTNEHPVLTGATFTVSSGDKFAICGGAGSGKSTLVMALARIPEISHGKVLIDDMDITDVPESIICSRLTIIPHDAAVLHQTVRYNLCPDGTKSDVDLWTVLEKVELKDIVELFPGQLDQVISEEYMNSTEKQQLFLAYTLLRETCIVVLDDVIRPENTTIRRILDKLFLQDWKHTTVIIVTNQADFLLTTTQTLVLESGCIVEQGHPAALIKKKSPFFPPVNLP